MKLLGIKILSVFVLTIWSYSLVHLVHMGLFGYQSSCPHGVTGHRICQLTYISIPLPICIIFILAFIFSKNVYPKIICTIRFFLIFIKRMTHVITPRNLQYMYACGILNPKKP